MFLIKDPIYNEIIINKSRFITNIIRVNSIDEVNENLSLLRKKYYDATHNCYAYILDSDTQKCSDDGEPSKTAGYPMLDVLKKQQLTYVLAVVTRYYGGIMLGAGGLVRAYSNSVSEALNKAIYYTIVTYEVYTTHVSYSLYNNLLPFLKDVLVIENSFMENVTLKIGLIKEKSQHLLNTFTDLTNGQTLSFLGLVHLETPNT